MILVHNLDVDISNVFRLFEERREELLHCRFPAELVWLCSVYTAAVPSLPYNFMCGIQTAMPCLIHNTRILFLSSPPAESQSGVFSQSSQHIFYAPWLQLDGRKCSFRHLQPCPECVSAYTRIKPFSSISTSSTKLCRA